MVEYSDNYLKTSGSLWQYYKDEANDNIADFESFKYKVKITGRAPADRNTKNVEIIVPLKYLSSFCRTLAMSLINCEVNLDFLYYLLKMKMIEHHTQLIIFQK